MSGERHTLASWTTIRDTLQCVSKQLSFISQFSRNEESESGSESDEYQNEEYNEARVSKAADLPLEIYIEVSVF